MWWRNAPIHIDGGQSGYVKHVLTWKQGPPSASPSDSKLVVWLALVNQDFWDPPGT